MQCRIACDFVNPACLVFHWKCFYARPEMSAGGISYLDRPSLLSVIESRLHFTFDAACLGRGGSKYRNFRFLPLLDVVATGGICVSQTHILFHPPPPPPGSNDRGHIVFVLSVVNFNICYNFWTVRDGDFIFDTPLMMPLQMTPWSMTLWSWLWPVLLKIAFPDFVATGGTVFHKYLFFNLGISIIIIPWLHTILILISGIIF